MVSLQTVRCLLNSLRMAAAAAAASLLLQTVTFVHRTLTEAGYRAVLLHGKRSQQEREAAVADFKAGKAQVGVQYLSASHHHSHNYTKQGV